MTITRESTLESYDEVLAVRGQWIVALNTLPKQQVFQLAAGLAELHTVRPLSVPQAGLTLLPLRDSVQHKAFYLGEIPLSSSHVEIISADGTTVEGAAQVMADDADFANALAICDGVLAHRLEGWTDVAAQVREGLATLNYEARIRKTMLTRSRVNFALLNEELEEKELEEKELEEKELEAKELDQNSSNKEDLNKEDLNITPAEEKR